MLSDFLLVSPLRKVKKMILPLRRQVTKNHKELISNILFLVCLRAFVAKNFLIATKEQRFTKKTIMKIKWINIRIILQLYLLVLVIFTIFRSILFFINVEKLNNISSSYNWIDIPLAFLMGIRFDIVISGYILLLPFLFLSVFYVIQKKSQILTGIIRLYLMMVFSLAFIICAIDIPYFNQFFNRFDISAFQWIDSPVFVLNMIIEEPAYWIISIPLIIILFLFYKGLKKILIFNVSSNTPRKIYLRILISLIFATIIFIGIRGRVQKKSPIRVGTAYFSNNQFLNKLGLNPVFTLMNSYFDSQNQENRFVNLMDDKTAIKNVRANFNINNNDYANPIARKILADSINQKNYNVIIIIMESMSAEKMSRYGNKRKLTPFLDSITHKSYCFDNIYTAGIHTYNGVYSTLFSFPALFRQHPMKGVEMKQYNGISKTLKKQNYSTIYFTTHDGQFDNVKGFLKANNFDKVITQSDYPSDKIKSTLGVTDDYLFEFSIPILNDLHEKHEAFFAAFMTASDHGPYIIPDYFTPKSENEKDQIVEYADWSLRKFIKMASKQKWFSNTIFVFVADHGSVINTSYSIPLSYHHSPLIIYAPEIINEYEKFDCIGGQIDIYPTIMGILDQPYVNNTFGIDLLKETRPYIYFCADDKLGVLNKEYYLIIGKDIKGLYKYGNHDKTNYINEHKDIAELMEKYVNANMQSAQYVIKQNLQGKD